MNLQKQIREYIATQPEPKRSEIQQLHLPSWWESPSVPDGRHAWKLSLACRGCLLVLHENVCLMTAHARLALHEWIGLQLCHLIAVTGVACA